MKDVEKHWKSLAFQDGMLNSINNLLPLGFTKGCPMICLTLDLPKKSGREEGIQNYIIKHQNPILSSSVHDSAER